ncbi:MAG: 4-phosphoerythronate dehydrogenase, partial [Alcanivoracaceae bacterium]|nr:4-phosphoerythronate dehydrogenase [Alcanivoracaceae bacterium]
MPLVPLRIVVDENMPGLQMFAGLGQVVRLPGREISRQQLLQADILLVRSVTRVDAALLGGTPVRFVGSATIGTDHIDLAWLEQQSIGFAHAPGCNAQAVSEYVLQAVLDWSVEQGMAVDELTVGVVGCGNVGARVASMFRASGATVHCCDPPRQRSGESEEGGWHSLEALLDCDVVSLHVPLIRSGPDSTYHLIGAQQLAAMAPSRLLINTCRGAVVDNQALLAVPPETLPQLVLDVWEDEPQVPEELFKRVRFGTPHIAGYIVEGKWRGSWMVYRALAEWCGCQPTVPQPHSPESDYAGDIKDLSDLLELLRSRYSMRADHNALQASLSDGQPALAFDRLRKNYPDRHELGGTRVRGTVAPRWRPLLSLLG